jgi:hypothetical protein
VGADLTAADQRRLVRQCRKGHLRRHGQGTPQTSCSASAGSSNRVQGDSLTSRRLFSLILGGTIPVILDDLLVLPYAAFLDWRQLAVFIPERRLFEDPDFDLITYLDAIPQSEIDRYRRHLRAVRRHFLFHEVRCPSLIRLRLPSAPAAQELIEPGDAVDLFVREMAMSTLKIRSNVRPPVFRADADPD